MITYVSSTRYINGTGIPRQDALGLSDFDVSESVFVGVPGIGGQYNRIFAAQTSRLLSDRIEVSLRTGTQYLEQVVGNSMAATSAVQVFFSLDEAKEITITTGPVFSGSGGGIASVVLLKQTSGGGSEFVFATSASGAPFTANVSAGTYRYEVISSSGSLMGRAGSSQVVATLVVPATSSIAALGIGATVVSSRRRVT